MACNRGFQDIDASADECDLRVAEFFQGPNWCSSVDDLVGVKTLREKLSRVLLQTPKGSLPTPISDIRHRITICNTTIGRQRLLK